MKFLLVENPSRWLAETLSFQSERAPDWVEDMEKALAAALVPEAYELPVALRDALPFEIRRSDGTSLALGRLTRAELPAGYGASAPSDPGLPIVAVTRFRPGNAVTGAYPYSTKRYFSAGDVIRNRDISVIAEGFRPGSTSFDSGRAREPDAPGAPVLTVGEVTIHCLGE